MLNGKVVADVDVTAFVNSRVIRLYVRMFNFDCFYTCKAPRAVNSSELFTLCQL